jgi:multisubunit Na+/H+ antiporter MnhE subunit
MADAPSPRDPQPGALRAWIVWWALLAALWMALVDTTATPELVTGAAAAAVAATGAVIVRAQRRVLLRPEPSWLLAAWRPAVGTVTDLRPLLQALWRHGIRRRPGGGRLVEVPYAAVGSDPRSTAHRALTQAFGSAAPNSIVVGIDHARRTMLVHELVETADPAAHAQPLPDP